MSRTIKVGGIEVVLPDDSPLETSVGVSSPAELQADKPDKPEDIQSAPYLYRPNDPFQGPIDRVVALGNVQDAKPWVRKAFLWVFLIIPFSVVQILAVGALFVMPEGEKLRQFLTINMMGLFAYAPYVAIWLGTSYQKRKMAAQASR